MLVKSNKPLVKSAYQKINYLISQPKQMLWVLNETVLLSTQNICSNWEGSGSVVECLTQDEGAAGSSLTGFTGLCP